MSIDKADRTLRDRVLAELDWEPRLDAADIGVAVKNHVVTLTGTVPHYTQKRTAEKTAFRVAGVQGVANDIAVRLPASARRTDAEIAEAALSALRWNVEVPHDRVTVSVDDGHVVLEGEVDWNYQRERAARVVRYLRGVHSVSNRLTVKARSSSTSLKSDIQQALRRRADEDARKIEVKVDGTTVTLSGTTSTWVERQAAEEAAWGAPGIVRVVNRIKVKPPAFA
jgi:osmotically-inducible protein OsmY